MPDLMCQHFFVAVLCPVILNFDNIVQLLPIKMGQVNVRAYSKALPGGIGTSVIDLMISHQTE